MRRKEGYVELKEELLALCDMKHNRMRGRRVGRIEKRVWKLRVELKKRREEREMRRRGGHNDPH